MSKTAQRKRSAYQMGFTIGLRGWPEGVKSVRVSKVAEGDWRKGLAHGRLARRIMGQQSQVAHTLKWWPQIKNWLNWLRGWPEGVKSVRVSKVAEGDWRAGLAHGRLARRTGEKWVQVSRTFKWWSQIKNWFRRFSK